MNFVIDFLVKLIELLFLAVYKVLYTEDERKKHLENIRKKLEEYRITIMVGWVAVTSFGIGTTALWLFFKDRFMIVVWSLLLVIVLFATSIIISGFAVHIVRKNKSLLRRFFFLAFSFSMWGLLCVVFLLLLKPIVQPTPCEITKFCVVVATFGEGPEYDNSRVAREVTIAVLENFEITAAQDPDLSFVEIQRIGLVTNAEQARTDATRIQADFIIWGRVNVSTDGVTLFYNVLETPDKISNPQFPRVLSGTNLNLAGIINIDNREAEEIVEGTTTLTAFTFGLAHYFEWDFIRANQAFRQVVTTMSTQNNSPQFQHLIHLYYGLSLQAAGQLEAANEQFEQAATLLDGDPAAPLAMAFSLRSLGENDESRIQAQLVYSITTQQIQENPQDAATAFFNRALADELLENYLDAVDDYRATLEQAPDLFIARMGLIRMLIHTGQYEAAIDVAQGAIEIAESNKANPAWAYFYLGRALEENEELEAAQTALQNASLFAPDIDFIHFQVGLFYERRADDINPEDSQYTAYLDEARREYEIMLGVTSNPAWGNRILGDVQMRLENYEAAINHYQTALRTQPDDAYVMIYLMDALLAGNTPLSDIQTVYNRAYEAEPDNLYVAVNGGRILFLAGDYEGAIEAWDNALIIQPEFCDVMVNIGVAYEQVNDEDAARIQYQQALTTNATEYAACHADAQRRLDTLQ